MNISFKIYEFFSTIKIWVLRAKSFLIHLYCPRSVNPHIFADPDPGCENVTDQDPDQLH